MIFLRQLIFFFTMIGFIQGPYAQTSQRAVEIKEALDLLPADQKEETFAQLYDRVWVRIPLLARLQLAPYLEGQGLAKVPKIAVNGNEVVIGDKKEVRLNIEEVKGDIVVKVNGKKLTDKQLDSVDDLHAAVSKILGVKRAAKKVSFWSVIVPEAKAFEISPLLVTLGVVGITVAVGAYVYQRNKKAKEEAEAAALAACSKQCCLVGNTWQRGCCAQIGGQGAGTPAGDGNPPMCPVGCTTQQPACYGTGTGTTGTTGTTNSNPYQSTIPTGIR